MQTKKKLLREVMTAVLGRGSKTCSFIEMRGLKLVYKRYASLYFCCAIGITDVFTGVSGLFYPEEFLASSFFASLYFVLEHFCRFSFFAHFA